MTLTELRTPCVLVDRVRMERNLDRMQAAGYVERVPCPTDRRVSYAALTATGRAKLDEAARVHAANLRAVFERFDDDDRSRLDALLDRLREVSNSPLAPGR